MILPISLGTTKAFLVKEDRCILIDTGTPGSDIKLFEKVRAEGIDPESVSLIILTHAHMDHIGSVWQAQKETGAPVALHKGDLEFFRTGEGAKVKSVCPAGHILRALMNLGVSSGIKKQDPDIILDSDFDLRPYGVQGKVLHTPGHTPGSVSVILQSGEAIVGDLIMGGFIHKTNPGLPLFADNLEEVRSSIRKVLSYSPSIIHAAHGGPFSPADVRRNIGIGES